MHVRRPTRRRSGSFASRWDRVAYRSRSGLRPAGPQPDQALSVRPRIRLPRSGLASDRSPAYSVDRRRNSYLNKMYQYRSTVLCLRSPDRHPPDSWLPRDTVGAASCLEVLAVTAVDPPAMGLPQVFTPAQAAEILRSLGLTDMTECALRTRAYRRQVPFHLNGRRIRFTATDLREIVEGQAQHPAANPAGTLPAASRPATRRSISGRSERPPQTWRARSPRDTSSADGKQR
jgi:hypothetical protein